MTKRKLWMYVGLVLAAALFTFGCGGDDGGLSADDMARIDNAEMAAASAMTAQAAAEAAQAEAESDAADARADAMAAAAAQAMAESDAADARADAMAAMAEVTQAKEDLQAAVDARQDAEAAQKVAEDAQKDAEDAQKDAEAKAMAAETKAAEYKERIEELEAELMAGPGTVGTADGGEGRAAAARIIDSVKETDAAEDDTLATPMVIDESMLMPARSTINSGASIEKLEQARLGRDPELTIELASGAKLDSATDKAEMDAPDVGADWMGVALEKMGAGGITQTALVYSDAERSVRAFGDAYPNNSGISVVTTAGEANLGAVTLDETAATHREVAALTFGGAVDADATAAQVPARVAPSLYAIPITLDHGLSTTGVMAREIGTLDNADNADAALTSVPDSVRGTYDSVSGVFTCVGRCALKLDAEGVLWWWASSDVADTTADAVLLFQADNAEQLLPDRDYLAFGTWTVVPDSPTHANPGEVGAFVKASAPAFDSQDINGLTGSAKYEGPAAGHYATRAAGSYDVKFGRFTAKATINASFDTAGSPEPMLPTGVTPQAATADQLAALNIVNETNRAGNAVTAVAMFGTTPGVAFSNSMIHSFMDADGNMMEGWVVNLDGPTMINNSSGIGVSARNGKDIVGGDIAGDADLDTVVGLDARRRAMAGVSAGTMLSGMTDGTTGALSWTGVWDASFHGTNTATTPTGIVGRFQADAGWHIPTHNAEGEINLFLDEGFAGVVGSFAGR